MDSPISAIETYYEIREKLKAKTVPVSESIKFYLGSSDLEVLLQR